MGDYWDDVDQYIRNQGTEQQIIQADILRRLSAAGPKHRAIPPGESDDRTIERNLGAFAGRGQPTQIPSPLGAVCCTGVGSQGLYYAWEGIVRYKEGTAQVNLLLNRASQLLDIYSYLPHEGKVIIKNKGAKKLFVRMPHWVDKGSTHCRIGQAKIHPIWLDNFMVLTELHGKERVTITFPMVQRTEKHTVYGKEFICQFRGNTLLHIEVAGELYARDDASFNPLRPWEYNGPAYPIYQREDQRKEVPPMRKVDRYVPQTLIEWYVFSSTPQRRPV